MSTRPNTAEAVAALTATLQAHMKVQDDRDAEARAARKTLSASMSAVERRLDGLERDMIEVKPVAVEAREWRSRSMGALTVLGVIGGVVWGLITFAREWILRMIGG